MANPLFQTFFSELADAQEDRHLFPFDASLGMSVTSWTMWEMLTMLRLINKYRLAAGKPLLSLLEVEKAEQMASGHFDYTSKFALYCSELVNKNTVSEFP